MKNKQEKYLQSIKEVVKSNEARLIGKIKCSEDESVVFKYLFSFIIEIDNAKVSFDIHIPSNTMSKTFIKVDVLSTKNMTDSLADAINDSICIKDELYSIISEIGESEI